MGLAQIIKFTYSSQELDELLLSLRYEKYSDGYILKTANCSIEIQITGEGLYTINQETISTISVY